MSFNAPPDLVKEAEHALRVDERVLRWMFTKKPALRRLNDFKARDSRNPNTMPGYDARRSS
jgi:ribosomal protein S6